MSIICIFTAVVAHSITTDPTALRDSDLWTLKTLTPLLVIALVLFVFIMGAIIVNVDIAVEIIMGTLSSWERTAFGMPESAQHFQLIKD